MAGVFQWTVFQANVFNRWFGGRSGLAGSAFILGVAGEARMHGVNGSCELYGIQGKAEI